MNLPPVIQTLSEQEAPPEQILASSLDFMRSCLQETSAPDLKLFWEVRQFCFPIFKQVVNRKDRADLWGGYMELTRQARQVKSTLEHESSFALEQIQLAIDDLSQQLQELFQAEQITLPIDFVVPEIPHALKEKQEMLVEKQAILHLLHLFGTRIQALRQELILTPARIKSKHILFQSLSALGDQVFPLKKKIVGEVNQLFAEEIQRFVALHFSPAALSSERIKRQFFLLRNEIKQLQTLAKFFSLEPNVFSETRTQLSRCWDSLKGMEKVVRKEFHESKQISTQQKQKLDEQLANFVADLEKGSLSATEADTRWMALKKQGHQAQLIRADMRAFLQTLDELHVKIDALLQAEQQVRTEQAQKSEQKRQQELEILFCDMEKIAEQLSLSGASEVLNQEIHQCCARIQQFPGSSEERREWMHRWEKLQDLWIATCEQQLDAGTTDSDNHAAWMQCIERRKQQRNELRVQIDEHRKMLSSSSLGIQRILQLQQELTNDKMRLGQCEEALKILEKRLRTHSVREPS